MQDQNDGFLAQLAAKAEASENTIAAYRNDLNQLAAFLADYRSPFGDKVSNWRQVGSNVLQAYMLEMKDREMEQQSFDLSQQYRRAPRDQREALKTQLQEVVQKHLEARQARRQLQLKRLEEELKQMREALERRTESRSQIVDRRIVELIGERGEFDL